MTSLDYDFASLRAASQPDPLQAQALVSDAHGQAAAIREAAHAEGLAAGHAQALHSVAPSLAALEHATAVAREHGESTAERLESEAVDLALAIAEKVLSAQVEVDPGVVLEAVRGALRGIVERERVTVLVNPGELELVCAARAELQASLGGIEQCEIQAERRVGPGGAMVRYADGLVDARIETKLERAREAVLEQLTS